MTGTLVITWKFSCAALKDWRFDLKKENKVIGLGPLAIIWHQNQTYRDVSERWAEVYSKNPKLSKWSLMGYPQSTQEGGE